MRRRLRQPKLLTQMIGFISIVVCLTVLFVSALFYMILDDIVENSLGNQAMTVAKMTAQKESIIKAFNSPDPSSIIQPIAEEIRKSTGAGYVVIGNKANVRYSHHLPGQIGKKLGTSSRDALNGKSVIYKGSGLSGYAIKAKTPIYDEKGEIIGVSSVGFLTNEIEGKIKSHRLKLLQIALFILFVGISGSVIIARRIKRLIFNLEPEEISYLFKEKEAALESIRDATIAVNKYLGITSINKRARELLKDGQIEKDGKIINERLISVIDTVLVKKQNLINQRFLAGHQLFLVDAAPILQKNQTSGAVLTIRPVSEIERLADEISTVKSISDNIRAQNHEYLNKLNTIYGLITLEQYDEARELISDEVKERQDRLVFLTSSVKDPFIAACLLGKINRSKEMKVHLEIDEESNLENIPSNFNTKMFVTVLGNIIDNAMEAASKKQGERAVVKVSFTDFGNDIIFDIDDNGTGIPSEWENQIFIEGFTTKEGENHG
ncbi:MAG TPA: sensor histidine kinase, partial [Chondromyces sp.]|nr:sensor histidine kinase [Chondromyces sp.]